MGSTRFPGKMLEKFCGIAILEWVLRRVQSANLIDKIVLATTKLERDDPLVELAQSLSVNIFRGSEDDVLGRFADAAEHFGASTVVRVCADNPLIAPEAMPMRKLRGEGFPSRL